ncbi:MAG: FecR family protein [Thermodesulfobacteriota bacterium]|nr:FecR family protein [Thermodesulfobacteriota bacterium]
MATRLILSLCGLIIFLSLCPWAQGQNLERQTARIIRIKGTVTVYQHQVQKWSAARKGMTVFQKDKMKTLPGSEVDLLMPDLAVIRLKENSLLDLDEIKKASVKPVASPRVLRVEKTPPYAKERNILRLWKGNLLLWVKHILAGSTFEVHTPIGVAGVRGTGFMVTIPDQDTTIVATLEGVVAVRNIARLDKIVLVRELEITTIRRETDPGKPRKVSEQEYAELKEILELKLLETGEEPEKKSDRGHRDVPSGMEDHRPMPSRPMTPSMMDRSGRCR